MRRSRRPRSSGCPVNRGSRAREPDRSMWRACSRSGFPSFCLVPVCCPLITGQGFEVPSSIPRLRLHRLETVREAVEHLAQRGLRFDAEPLRDADGGEQHITELGRHPRRDRVSVSRLGPQFGHLVLEIGDDVVDGVEGEPRPRRRDGRPLRLSRVPAAPRQTVEYTRPGAFSSRLMRSQFACDLFGGPPRPATSPNTCG